MENQSFSDKAEDQWEVLGSDGIDTADQPGSRTSSGRLKLRTRGKPPSPKKKIELSHETTPKASTSTDTKALFPDSPMAPNSPAAEWGNDEDLVFSDDESSAPAAEELNLSSIEQPSEVPTTTATATELNASVAESEEIPNGAWGDSNLFSDTSVNEGDISAPIGDSGAPAAVDDVQQSSNNFESEQVQGSADSLFSPPTDDGFSSWEGEKDGDLVPSLPDVDTPPAAAAGLFSTAAGDQKPDLPAAASENIVASDQAFQEPPKFPSLPGTEVTTTSAEVPPPVVDDASAQFLSGAPPSEAVDTSISQEDSALNVVDKHADDAAVTNAFSDPSAAIGVFSKGLSNEIKNVEVLPPITLATSESIESLEPVTNAFAEGSSALGVFSPGISTEKKADEISEQPQVPSVPQAAFESAPALNNIIGESSIDSAAPPLGDLVDLPVSGASELFSGGAASEPPSQLFSNDGPTQSFGGAAEIPLSSGKDEVFSGGASEYEPTPVAPPQSGADELFSSERPPNAFGGVAATEFGNDGPSDSFGGASELDSTSVAPPTSEAASEFSNGGPSESFGGGAAEIDSVAPPSSGAASELFSNGGPSESFEGGAAQIDSVLPPSSEAASELFSSEGPTEAFGGVAAPEFESTPVVPPQSGASELFSNERTTEAFKAASGFESTPLAPPQSGADELFSSEGPTKTFGGVAAPEFESTPDAPPPSGADQLFSSEGPSLSLGAAAVPPPSGASELFSKTETLNTTEFPPSAEIDTIPRSEELQNPDSSHPPFSDNVVEDVLPAQAATSNTEGSKPQEEGRKSVEEITEQLGALKTSEDAPPLPTAAFDAEDRNVSIGDDVMDVSVTQTPSLFTEDNVARRDSSQQSLSAIMASKIGGDTDSQIASTTMANSSVTSVNSIHSSEFDEQQFPTSETSSFVTDTVDPVDTFTVSESTVIESEDVAMPEFSPPKSASELFGGSAEASMFPSRRSPEKDSVSPPNFVGEEPVAAAGLFDSAAEDASYFSNSSSFSGGQPPPAAFDAPPPGDVSLVNSSADALFSAAAPSTTAFDAPAASSSAESLFASPSGSTADSVFASQPNAAAPQEAAAQSGFGAAPVQQAQHPVPHQAAAHSGFGAPAPVQAPVPHPAAAHSGFGAAPGQAQHTPTHAQQAVVGGSGFYSGQSVAQGYNAPGTPTGHAVSSPQPHYPASPQNYGAYGGQSYQQDSYNNSYANQNPQYGYDAASQQQHHQYNQADPSYPQSPETHFTIPQESTGYYSPGLAAPNSAYQQGGGPVAALHFNPSVQYDIPSAQPQAIYSPTTQSSFRDPAAKPHGCIVSFGFGGQLVVMFPKRKVKLNMLGSSRNSPRPAAAVPEDTNTPGESLRKGPILIYPINNVVSQDLHFQQMASFPGPLLSTQNITVDVITGFIDSEVSKLSGADEDTILLWSLMRLFVKFGGCFRSEQGKGSQPDSPETAICALLKESVDRRKASSTPPIASKTPVGAADELITPEQVEVARSKIRDFLMSGNRPQAIDVAMEAHMWSEAMLIASYTDHETYTRAVMAFVNASYGHGDPLRTLCMSFGGQQERSVHEGDLPSGETSAVLSNWVSQAIIMVANVTGDTNKVLRELGDRLWKETGSVAAAHSCYLMASVSVEHPSPSTRMVLIGGDHRDPEELRFYVSPQTIQLTEIFEWTRQMMHSRKRLPPLISFQAYKLVYAMQLADAGHADKAFQYVQCIAQSLQTATAEGAPGAVSSYIKNLLLQIQVFEDRLRRFLGAAQLVVAESTQEKSEANIVSKTLGFMDCLLSRRSSDATASQPAEANTVANDIPAPLSPHTTPLMEPTIPQQQQMPPVLVAQQQQAPLPAPVPMHLSPQVQNVIANEGRVDSAPSSFHGGLSLLHTAHSSADLSNLSRSEMSQAAADARENRSKTPPASMSTADGKAPNSGNEAGWFGGLSNYFAEKMNPDAKVAKLGTQMEAYFDEEKKRWIFPGEDPNEDSGPPPAPPTDMMMKASPEAEGGQPASAPSNDPLAALMAPPASRSHAPPSQQDPLSAMMAPPPSRNIPRTAGPKKTFVGNSSQMGGPNSSAAAKPPRPQYAVFKPPPSAN